MTTRPSSLASLLSSTGLDVTEEVVSLPVDAKPLTTTQRRARDLIRSEGGHAIGEGSGIRASTAGALVRRSLIVLGWKAGTKWAISVDQVANPPEGFRAGARRGAKPRAEAAASRRLEFRVSPSEGARIERLLRERGGSLSGLVRELLTSEADRLGIDS